MDAFRLFDVCCSCPLQLLEFYLLLCTESISWLKSWSGPLELSYNLNMNFDLNLEDHGVGFHRVFSSKSSL